MTIHISFLCLCLSYLIPFYCSSLVLFWLLFWLDKHFQNKQLHSMSHERPLSCFVQTCFTRSKRAKRWAIKLSHLSMNMSYWEVTKKEREVFSFPDICLFSVPFSFSWLSFILQIDSSCARNCIRTFIQWIVVFLLVSRWALNKFPLNDAQLWAAAAEKYNYQLVYVYLYTNTNILIHIVMSFILWRSLLSRVSSWLHLHSRDLTISLEKTSHSIR